MRSVICTSALGVASLALLLGPATSHGSDYTITPPFLPRLSAAYGINNAGQVVGFGNYEVSPGVWTVRGFIYSGGTPTFLGTFGGNLGVALAVNSSGQVTGYATYPNNSRTPFVYSNSVMTPLPGYGGNQLIGQGRAINNVGQVAGYAESANGGPFNAFLYSSGVTTNLGTLGGSISAAYGVNDAGVVVGTSDLAGNVQRHAFSYSNGTMTDLGTLGGATSYALAINEIGQTVGWSLNAMGRTRAFLYANNVMTDLGTLGGADATANAINDQGQVVGTSLNASGQPRAFLYTNGVMFDLNDLITANSGWVLEEAYGINASGQIVGYGRHASDTQFTQKAFLMTLNPVPEPSAFSAIGSAFVVFVAHRTWRRTRKPPLVQP